MKVDISINVFYVGFLSSSELLNFKIIVGGLSKIKS